MGKPTIVHTIGDIDHRTSSPVYRFVDIDDRSPVYRFVDIDDQHNVIVERWSGDDAMGDPQWELVGFISSACGNNTNHVAILGAEVLVLARKLSAAYNDAGFESK